MYINDKVGKCNRLDKCGYHYTPPIYFENNPLLRDRECSFVLFYRENERTLYLFNKSCTEDTLLYPSSSAICLYDLPSSRTSSGKLSAGGILIAVHRVENRYVL